MFRMTIWASALTLFDAHLVVNNADWPQVDTLFSSQYDSETKERDISDDLSSLHVSDSGTTMLLTRLGCQNS